MVEIGLFSVSVPLWAIFLCALIVLVFVWGFFRFTLKILLFFVAFFVLIIGLDWLGVFGWINQNILANFL